MMLAPGLTCWARKSQKSSDSLSLREICRTVCLRCIIRCPSRPQTTNMLTTGQWVFLSTEA